MDNYQIYSVGDSCLTLSVGNHINEIFNEKVIAVQRWFNLHSFKGLKDVVVAFNSVSILYDPVVIKHHQALQEPISAYIRRKLALAWEQAVPVEQGLQVIRIPVCYGGEEGPDLSALAALREISEEELVRYHTAQPYRIYMIGFLPGFPYMASVPEKIAAPRKQQPASVAAGSIGIAGLQTGIYPLSSPGGWQIIGKTPVSIFDSGAADPFLLHTGNYVQFYAISKQDFVNWKP